MSYTEHYKFPSNENEICSRLKKITTFAVCLSPILFIYRALKFFMLGEIVLILCLFTNLIVSAKTDKYLSRKQFVIFVFAFTILFLSSIGYLVNDNIGTEVLPRLIRLLFCLFVAALIGGYFFDGNEAKKYIVLISIIATIVIMFQKIYHEFTGNFIYFIFKDKIYSKTVYNAFYFQNVEIQSIYRPMSFFLEPSHFCQYVLFAVSIELFKNKISFTEVLVAMFLSVGIFISTSSTGVIICLILWAVWIFDKLKHCALNKLLNLKMFFIFIFIFAGGVLSFILVGDRLLFAVQRILPNGSSSSSAWTGRLGTFSVFSENESIFNFLFGRGYGAVESELWYASIPYYFYGVGAFGIMAIVIFFVSLYCLSNDIQKRFLIVFFALCAVTEVLTNYWLIFILPLIMTITNDKGHEKS